MAFLDKLKGVKDSVVTSASNVAQKAKESYADAKQAQMEKKAAEEAYRQEMTEKANSLANELIEGIHNATKENQLGFFSQNSESEIQKFTKEFYEKILLPANSVRKSYLSMHPYIDDKQVKKILKSFGFAEVSGDLLLHIKDKEAQEFMLTYDTFYFKLALPEDKRYFAIGQIPVKDIDRFELKKEEGYYAFLCDGYKLAQLLILDSREEDFITLNKYFTDIKAQDLEIKDEEIDKIIQEKIGSKIYKQVKKYMVYDDELAIYFAWGLDSLAAKDYIVCTTKQIIIMDREAFGGTMNVKQLYYEDITSAQTIQNTGDSSLTGMLIDAAFASLFQQCDLEITVAGSKTRINTLCKVEAERVISIYHEYRKKAKTASAQPQQVIVQQNQPDVLEQIEKLAKLKDMGVLSAEEFDKKKAELLLKL